jgi:hypothetical protein
MCLIIKNLLLTYSEICQFEERSGAFDTRKIWQVVKESGRGRTRPSSNGVAQAVPESSDQPTVSRSHGLSLPAQRLSQPEPRSRLPVRVASYQATPCQGRAGGRVGSGGTFIGALAESLDWCGRLEKPHGRPRHTERTRQRPGFRPAPSRSHQAADRVSAPHPEMPMPKQWSGRHSV